MLQLSRSIGLRVDVADLLQLQRALQPQGVVQITAHEEVSIHEECGVFGVIAPRPTDVGRLAYYGLYALQHRGQESCGIVVNDDGIFASRKDLGLVGEVFSG